MKKDNDGLDVYQFKNTSSQGEEIPPWLVPDGGLLVRKTNDDLIVVVNKNADFKALQDEIIKANKQHELYLAEIERIKRLVTIGVIAILITSIITNFIK